jgi:FKBP-type peptidyl-prolyl cis-trans isomerase SlyD
MKIAENCVVSIHYRLTDDEGEELDSSAAGEPLVYLHGADNIIPGLRMP